MSRVFALSSGETDVVSPLSWELYAPSLLFSSLSDSDSVIDCSEQILTQFYSQDSLLSISKSSKESHIHSHSLMRVKLLKSW
jgi:hypothetical protein